VGVVAPISVGFLTASISRSAGGLFWAVPPLANGIMRSGGAVKVFSIGDAPSDGDAVHWGDVRLDVRSRRGPTAFGYAPELANALDAARLDLVHTHGLWMYPSVAASRWAARWKKPLVVSPHGMLDSWALRNAAWKKRLAGWLFENRHLQRATCLHALNDAEYEAIRGYGLTNPVAIIPNGIDLMVRDETLVRPEWAASLPDSARVLLFLGRLHPKKGLVSLLRAWGRVRCQVSAGTHRWHLVIAGWDQGGHEFELRRLAEALQLGETVRFVGPQFDAQKSASIAFADGFVLPSFSEGLPMAVLEAWARRLPVLMTPQCNLPEGFESGGAMEIAPDADRLADGLAAFFDLPEAERQAMGDRGRRLVEERFDWSAISAQMSDVYAWILGRQKKPTCVRIDYRGS
jgi:poly(glycerol-phosphate) alpha-glucosyltransferase